MPRQRAWEMKAMVIWIRCTENTAHGPKGANLLPVSIKISTPAKQYINKTKRLLAAISKNIFFPPAIKVGEKRSIYAEIKTKI